MTGASATVGGQDSLLSLSCRAQNLLSIGWVDALIDL